MALAPHPAAASGRRGLPLLSRAEAAAQRRGRTEATRRREAPLRPRLVPARSPPRRLPQRGGGGLSPRAGAGIPARTPTAHLDSRPPVRPCRGATAGALAVATRCPPWPSRPCTWPWTAGTVMGIDNRSGSPSIAASHSQGAHPDRRGTSCSESRVGGTSSPPPATPPPPGLPLLTCQAQGGLCYQVLRRPGRHLCILPGKFSL